MTATFFSRVFRGYREIGSRAGFLGLLVVLSAALGALIALPLWLFATSAPRVYSLAVLAAAAAAALTAAVRRVLRSGISWPRAAAKALAILLGIAKAALLLAGLYAAAAFAAQRRYAAAAAGIVVFLAAAAWIGWGMHAGTQNRARSASRRAGGNTSQAAWNVPIIRSVKTRIPPVPVAALLLSLACAVPAAADYPELRTLTRDDPLFVQLQAELDAWYRLSQDHYTPVAERPAPPPLAIFSYRRRTSEDLFSLNARLNMPYDSLVTLNAAASRAQFDALDRVLIPTRPGLFVTDPPASALEDMMLASRVARGLTHERIVVQRGGAKAGLWFFPGESFNAVERAYFLQILYDFPIVNRGNITSRYGSRADPFTGDPAFHNGIDIGAAEGTPVHAARDGTASEVGRNDILGNYVIITHPGDWQTVYGHLSSVAVASGAKVARDAVIGTVGSTGQGDGTAPALRGQAQGRRGRPLSAAGHKKGLIFRAPMTTIGVLVL